jgi:hypothetical protein
MSEKKVDEMILTCDVCGEPLRARAISVQKKMNNKFRLLSKPEIFCPECDKGFNLIGRFKKQYAKKKQEQKNSL